MDGPDGGEGRCGFIDSDHGPGTGADGFDNVIGCGTSSSGIIAENLILLSSALKAMKRANPVQRLGGASLQGGPAGRKLDISP
ncbi:UNVERIFIED_ORG: hypothetical protein ABIB52_003016 [Arthrobacter sp. UYCu721]